MINSDDESNQHIYWRRGKESRIDEGRVRKRANSHIETRYFHIIHNDELYTELKQTEFMTVLNEKILP